MRRTIIRLAAAALLHQLPAAAQEREPWEVLLSEAMHLVDTGHYQEAHMAAQQALREVEKLGLADPRVAYALLQTATSYNRLGRFGDAEHDVRRGIALLEASPAEHSLVLSHLYDALGGALAMQDGRSFRAEAAYRRALELGALAKGLGHAHLAIIAGNLATVLALRRDLPGAAKLLRQARLVLETAPGMERSAAIVVADLGALAILEGRPADALPDLMRAIELLRQSGGADHPELIPPLLNLGRAYLRLGRAADAVVPLGEAQVIAEAKFGADHPSLAGILESHAAGLHKTGDHKEARQLERRCRHIRGLNHGLAVTAATVSISDLLMENGKPRHR